MLNLRFRGWCEYKLQIRLVLKSPFSANYCTILFDDLGSSQHIICMNRAEMCGHRASVHPKNVLF